MTSPALKLLVVLPGACPDLRAFRQFHYGGWVGVGGESTADSAHTRVFVGVCTIDNVHSRACVGVYTASSDHTRGTVSHGISPCQL